MDLQQRTPPRTARGERAPTRANFAVHEEGEGLQALYLTPCPLEVVADALEDLGVAVLYGAGRVRMPTPLLAALGGPLDLTSAPCSHPVLAAPHAAVPSEAGAFAAARCGSANGVIYARDPRVLRAVLRRWLAAHLDSVGVDFGLDGVGEEAIRRLATPMPHTCWQEPRLRRAARLCTLEFHALSTEGTTTDRERVRWIGGQRYGWRTDWAW